MNDQAATLTCSGFVASLRNGLSLLVLYQRQAHVNWPYILLCHLLACCVTGVWDTGVWDAETYLLCDDFVPDEQFVGWRPTFCFTSPKPKAVNKFTKGVGVAVRYLPCWTLVELQNAAQQLMPDLTVSVF